MKMSEQINELATALSGRPRSYPEPNQVGEERLFQQQSTRTSPVCLMWSVQHFTEGRHSGHTSADNGRRAVR